MSKKDGRQYIHGSYHLVILTRAAVKRVKAAMASDVMSMDIESRFGINSETLMKIRAGTYVAAEDRPQDPHKDAYAARTAVEEECA